MTQTEKYHKTILGTEKNGGNEKVHHKTEVVQEKTRFRIFRQKTQGNNAEDPNRAENAARQIQMRSSTLREITQKSFSKGLYAGSYEPTAINFINWGEPAKLNRVTLTSEIC